MMYYKQCKIGLPVKLNRDGAFGKTGTTGHIHELRGYNFEHGKVVSRWVMVWLNNSRVVMCSSNEIDKSR